MNDHEQQLTHLLKFVKFMTGTAVLITTTFIILYTNTDLFINHAENRHSVKELNIENDLISPKTVESRVWWASFMATTVGGMMLTAAGLAAAYWVNTRGETGSTSARWYLAIGISIVGGLGFALSCIGCAKLGNVK